MLIFAVLLLGCEPEPSVIPLGSFHWVDAEGTRVTQGEALVAWNDGVLWGVDSESGDAVPSKLAAYYPGGDDSGEDVIPPCAGSPAWLAREAPPSVAVELAPYEGARLRGEGVQSSGRCVGAKMVNGACVVLHEPLCDLFLVDTMYFDEIDTWATPWVGPLMPTTSGPPSPP